MYTSESISTNRALSGDPFDSAYASETPSNQRSGNTIEEFSDVVVDAGPPSELHLEKSGYPTANLDEEVDILTMIRMLEDRYGRLQFVGDSANLSFVQLLRMIVETIYGPSAFVLDPERHRMLEIQDQVSLDVEAAQLLPGKETATALVNSFFTNTYGILEVFEEEEFLKRLDQYYKESFASDPMWLSHLYLVLAIGLCLATLKTGSREVAIVDSLRSSHPKRSEEYFVAAKKFHDPLFDLEYADFPSIQTLTLMALYMLYRGRRNLAYLHTGMAIRLAYTLGLHREETLGLFSEEKQNARRNVWRSLFTLDCYLSVSLGRPLAVGQNETSANLLPTTSRMAGETDLPHKSICRHGLEATISSCHLMRLFLSKIYTQRRVSIDSARALADECRHWQDELPPCLHSQQASPRNPRQAMAILHCNLAYFHAVILLTRPFFLYLMSTEIQRDRLKMKVGFPHRLRDMQQLSDACLAASAQTIALVQNAYEGGYLPRMNFWPTYGVFGAALIIFANEIAQPHSNKGASQYMQNSITILEYCGKSDPLASRSAKTLRSFLDVIRSQNPRLGIPPQDYAHSSAEWMQYPNLPGLSLHSILQSNDVPPTNAAATAGPVEAQSPVQKLMEDSTFLGRQDLENSIQPILPETMMPSIDEHINLDELWDWPNSALNVPPG